MLASSAIMWRGARSLSQMLQGHVCPLFGSLNTDANHFQSVCKNIDILNLFCHIKYGLLNFLGMKS